MIRVLDETTSGQIAAGEVIERPVSAVKELVENSLDAGATRIEINIAPGGMEFSVTDNGSGMSADDAYLAFGRHATSKISRLADLVSVGTMGFRGEALPSIAAVAKVELLSCLPGADGATRVVVIQGRVAERGPAAGPPGTTVWVRELFQNLPVRKKHLKSESFEFGLIQEMVGRLALARTEVCFVLCRDGREVFFAAGGGSLSEVASSVYGLEIARQMIPFGGEGEGVGFRGLAGHPSVARASRRYQAIFVNGRWVKNYALSRAVEDAYRNLLMTGRYPPAVLDLKLDPGLVDVNVHPSKLDVRLLDEPLVAGLVKEGVRQALSRHSLVPAWQGPPVRPALQSQPLAFSYSPPDAAPDHPARPEPSPLQDIVREESKPYQAVLPSLAVLAWLPPTYILAQGDHGSGLYIIDQHAAHERVLYEEKLSRIEEGGTPSQVMAIPLSLELDQGQVTALEKNLPLLESLGFALEPFGGAYLLRAAPAWGGDGSGDRTLLDVLDALLDKGAFTRTDLVDRLVITWSCKGAVKAGKRLEYAEMTALVKQLAHTKAPYTCPHGRPTVICIEERELLSRFKRIV